MAVPPPPPGRPLLSMSEPTLSKTDLRRELRRRRAALAADPAWRDDLLVHTLFLADHVVRRLGEATCVAGYAGDGEEVDPTPILFAAIDRGLRVALPHLSDQESPMRFLAWAPGDVLVPGAFGLLQPRSDAEEVSPDLILAPLVGFDRRLARLGRGAGYYDRAFARLPDARRVGLAWSAQEAETVPTDPWDVPLHGVATEREWIGA